MASSVIGILSTLGLDENSSLEQVLSKLVDYNLVTTDELHNIQNISVKPLPNIVRNQADILKQRMYGIATDEDYGLPVVINRRMVLVRYILSKLNIKVEDLIEDLTNGDFVVEKAKRDQLGHNIIGTYETKADATDKNNTITTRVQNLETNLRNGDFVVNKATNDANGNNIAQTYETKADATTKKNQLNSRITTLETSLEEGYLVVNKAYNDSAGNNIAQTYETKQDATTKNNTITNRVQNLENNITSGAFVANKAINDAEGNTITTTYETKLDAQAKLETAKSYTDAEIQRLYNLRLGEYFDALYDTFKEISDYIASDKSVAQELLTKINQNTTNISTNAANITTNSLRIDNLNSEVSNKANASEVYKKTESYNKNEIDKFFEDALSIGFIADDSITIKESIKVIDNSTLMGKWIFTNEEWLPELFGTGTFTKTRADFKDSLGNSYKYLEASSIGTTIDDVKVHKYICKGYDKDDNEILIFDPYNKTGLAYNSGVLNTHYFLIFQYENDLIRKSFSYYAKKVSFKTSVVADDFVYNDNEIATKDFVKNIIDKKTKETNKGLNNWIGNWVFTNENVEITEMNEGTILDFKDNLGNLYSGIYFRVGQQTDGSNIAMVKGTLKDFDKDVILFDPINKAGFAYKNGILRNDYYLTFESEGYVSNLQLFATKILLQTDIKGDILTFNDKEIATKEDIANLVNAAPETLDTLGEVAQALKENDTVVEALNASIGNKVDKVNGKGLSTNDFTNQEKQKLQLLENYDDTEIKKQVSTLESKVESLEQGGGNNSGNGTAVENIAKSYSLNLGGTSWVRLAKIKDVEKLTSAIFTLNCYGYAEKLDMFEQLTSSVFSVSCKFSNNKLEADILPITHVQTGGATGGSGDGSGGSGSSGGSTYGLVNVTIEEHMGELYVCGLINFPAIEMYDSCYIDLLINNNTNIDYLNELEMININGVTELNETSLIEGISFPPNKNYKINLRTSLNNVIECYDNKTPLSIELHDSVVDRTYTLVEIREYYGSYGQGTFNNNPIGGNWGNWVYNGSIISGYKQLYVITSESFNLNIFNSINTYYGFAQSDNGKITKLSGTLKSSQAVQNATIYINGEIVATFENEEINYSCENLIYGIDDFEVSGTSVEGNALNFSFDSYNCEYELSMNTQYAGSISNELFRVTHIYTTNNDLYNFSITYEGLFSHNTSKRVALESMYDWLYDLTYDVKSCENSMNGVRNIATHLNNVNTKMYHEVQGSGDVKMYDVLQGVSTPSYGYLYPFVIKTPTNTFDNIRVAVLPNEGGTEYRIVSVLDGSSYYETTITKDSVETDDDVAENHKQFLTEGNINAKTSYNLIETPTTLINGNWRVIKNVSLSIETPLEIEINFKDSLGNKFDKIEIIDYYNSFILYGCLNEVRTIIYNEPAMTGFVTGYYGGFMDDYYLIFEEENEEILNFLKAVANKYSIETEVFSDSLKLKGKQVATLEDVQNSGGSSGIELTYSELVSLRDNSQLVAGATYIITDYECTTSTPNTRSAGHNFDIIVTADNENTLSEFARARKHKGDTYFEHSNLAAWELKYSLDNDTSSFKWADTVNGKGVIYYMKDEWDNEVPYDFKNITYQVKEGFVYNQFGSDYKMVRNELLDTVINEEQYYGYTANNSISAVNSADILVKDNPVTTSSALYKLDGSQINYGGSIKEVNPIAYDYYTFNYEIGNPNNYELTAVNYVNYNSRLLGCRNNKITAYSGLTSNSSIKQPFELDNNVFDACCSYNKLENCKNNTIHQSCHHNNLSFSSNNIIYESSIFNTMKFAVKNKIKGYHNTLIETSSNYIDTMNAVLERNCNDITISRRGNGEQFNGIVLKCDISNLTLDNLEVDSDFSLYNHRFVFEKVPNGDIIATWMDSTHKLVSKYTTDNGATWLDVE